MTGPVTIAEVNTDYPSRPPHRGHTVSVELWSDECVMLVIKSDDRTNEAVISTEELLLAEEAKKALRGE